MERTNELNQCLKRFFSWSEIRMFSERNDEGTKKKAKESERERERERGGGSDSYYVAILHSMS